MGYARTHAEARRVPVHESVERRVQIAETFVWTGSFKSPTRAALIDPVAVGVQSYIGTVVARCPQAET
jgi:hypothetical protein